MDPKAESGATKSASKAARPAKEKAKALGYVNWEIPNPKSTPENPLPPIMRSRQGFTVLDNEFATLEERELINLAVKNGGQARLMAIFRVIEAKEKPTEIDTSEIPLLD